MNQLQQFLYRRSAITRHRACFYCPISMLSITQPGPFNRLPLELISEIFLIFCGAQYYYGSKSEYWHGRSYQPTPRFRSCPPQLLLTQLSSHWRAVAHSMHHLWVELTIHVKTGNCPHHAELATAWLMRSGESLPLEINISIPKGKGGRNHVKRLIESTIPFMHRWRSLKLAAPLQPFIPLLACRFPDAPLLEHVDFHICQITKTSLKAYARLMPLTVFAATPLLHSVAVGVSHGANLALRNRSDFQFPDLIPYAQVVRLIVDGGTYSSLSRGTRFLRLFSDNLVFLTLNLPLNLESEYMATALTLKRLSSLTISALCQDAANLFDFLTLPSLEVLEVQGFEESDDHTLYQALVHLRTRSSFALKKLTLRDTLTVPDEIVSNLLESLDSLKTLTFQEDRCTAFHPIMRWLQATKSQESRGQDDAPLDAMEVRWIVVDVHTCLNEECSQVVVCY
ncbi:hypothetical protein BDP27DRAFT_21552 [Rhodocollybia butyracea]|uniref:F-box domain-containing protein n=1 Tax=Rhodocollybia butyracea TaxID=206335 RepID=A0A9P5QAJ1_9AGAR|nr:hypothetical protein BDP27DRAFT_21552 [Rhodocollybia butyracea]